MSNFGVKSLTDKSQVLTPRAHGVTDAFAVDTPAHRTRLGTPCHPARSVDGQARVPCPTPRDPRTPTRPVRHLRVTPRALAGDPRTLAVDPRVRRGPRAARQPRPSVAGGAAACVAVSWGRRWPALPHTPSRVEKRGRGKLWLGLVYLTKGLRSTIERDRSHERTARLPSARGPLTRRHRCALPMPALGLRLGFGFCLARRRCFAAV